MGDATKTKQMPAVGRSFGPSWCFVSFGVCNGGLRRNNVQTGLSFVNNTEEVVEAEERPRGPAILCPAFLSLNSSPPRVKQPRPPPGRPRPQVWFFTPVGVWRAAANSLAWDCSDTPGSVSIHKPDCTSDRSVTTSSFDKGKRLRRQALRGTLHYLKDWKGSEDIDFVVSLAIMRDLCLHSTNKKMHTHTRTMDISKSLCATDLSSKKRPEILLYCEST